MEDVIILGTGCAGFTAGIYTARANLNPLILEGNNPVATHHNFRGRKLPRLSRGNRRIRPDGSIAQTSGQVRRKGRECVCGQGRFQQPVKVLYAGDRKLEAKTVIIATGAAPRLLNIPGSPKCSEEGSHHLRNL